MTTAYFRQRARDYEARCEWQLAAQYYHKAIEAYPKESRQGELYLRDIGNLIEARDSCSAMAAREQ